ncbi:hypothetical protein [Amphibacillus indicireducens]|uniref:ABC transporter permease n=1 Tax=Amphibacillus indicireducens TaxID=1076330 RepID=A0ABP7VWH0_9BACI
MKLKKDSNIVKLALDFYSMQMKWTFWYLIVVFALSIIASFFLSDITEWERGIVESIYSASKIYLAIVALFTCFAMLGFSVKNGITRKDYFHGTAIAAIGLSFSIIIIGSILSFIFSLFDFDALSSGVSFLDTRSTWIVPIGSLSLILLSYYIAGWIIASGYYRFGGLKTISFVMIGISFVSIIGLLWEHGIEYYIESTLLFSTDNIPIIYKFGVTLALIGLALWLVRLITKRIPIKIE